MTVVVKKRKKTSSHKELQRALKQFAELLVTQDENEAAEALQTAHQLLEKETPEKTKEAIELILEAFEGEHELEAYTFSRKDAGEGWTDVDALYLASTSVLSLTNRIKKST